MHNGGRPDRSSPRKSRGQTTIDFAIGISIFLAVILFTFLFVPGILAPFTGSAQAETVSTNQVADQLTKDMLGSPRQPYTLSEYCTVQFFANNSAPGCTFEQKPVQTQFGFDSTQQGINISVRGNASTTPESDEALCWDDNAETLLEKGDGNCNVDFVRGDAPPQNDTPSVTAQRVVFLDGQDVTVYVEMW